MIKDTLKNDKVLLRQLTLEDAPSLHEMLSDPILCEKAGLLEHSHISQTMDFIMSNNMAVRAHQELLYGIFVNNNCVGIINLFNINHIEKSGEYGYFIGTKYTRKGYMSEAIKLLSNHLLETKEFDEISVYVDTTNHASLQLARNLKLIEKETSIEEDMRNRSVEMKQFVITKKIT